MKAVVKVSHLRTDDALYCRGDTVDLPEERVMQLGSSVVRTEPEPEVVETVADEVAEVVEPEPEPEVVEPKTPKRGTRKR